MPFAPVVVFTYNRYNEIMLVMEALQKNIHAKDTDIYIFSNAPTTGVDGDAEKVKMIRKDLQQFRNGFQSFTLVERGKNQGPNENMIYGINYVMKKYDRAIVLEDDILTAKNFLSFMNQALNVYEDDKEVFSICAYNPVVIECQLSGDTFSYDAFRSWGWAIWKDRWESFDENEDTLSKIDLPKVHSEGLMYISCIRYDIISRNNPSVRYLDYKLACKQMADKKTVIYSKRSLCDNIGMIEDSLTSISKGEYENKNFDIDNNNTEFVFSKNKLNIRSDREYFLHFRQEEYAMHMYFERNFNRNFLYHNMYFGLSYLYSKGFDIGYYFKKHAFKSIAIYGWGEAGRFLYEIAGKSGVKVLYAMDRNTFSNEKRIKIYQQFPNLPRVDAVIVTAIQAYSKIEEDIHLYFECPLVSMDDIVAECKVDLIDNSKL